MLNATWHSDNQRKQRAFALMHTQIFNECMYLHGLTGKDYLQGKAVAHPHRMRCKTLFPLNACCIIIPSTRLEMLDKDILVGCCARVESSELFNCSCVFNRDDGMNQSLGNTIQSRPHLSVGAHPFVVS